MARWDITNSEWLTTWTEDNVLDNGNEIVTSLIADIRPGYIWVGGRDGFQLLEQPTERNFTTLKNQIHCTVGTEIRLT